MSMKMDSLNSTAIDEFWGAELSSKNKVVSWEAEDEDDDDAPMIEKVLEIRQACLGASAKEGERNVVQLTTENDEGDIVDHTILSLRVGGAEQSSLFLTLHPPVKFQLVAGSGPVHIVGTTVETFEAFDSDMDSDDSDEEVEIPSPAMISAAKKRPGNFPTGKPAKQIKLEKNSAGDSSTADSMDTSSGSNGNPKRKIKKEEPEEEEDESDFDEDDDEDMSGEDSEDQEDEESEEEEEVKPPTKKPVPNGKPNKKGGAPNLQKGKMSKTPQPSNNKPKHKGPASAPTTPKQRDNNKKAGNVKIVTPGGSTPTIDEVKKRLLKQIPNVPRKLEKFNNFLGNSYKIKDAAVKKDLWEFLQKNRPEK